MELERIQQALQAEQLDGWLFYDFRRSNPVAHQVLSLPIAEMYTRRWFYFVPDLVVGNQPINAPMFLIPSARRFFCTHQIL